MKKMILIFMAIIFIYNLSYCQEVKFIALNVKGKVNLIKGSKTLIIKVGDKIYDKDKIKINKNTYLDLVYKDGRTLNLRKAGEYDSKKLISLINSNKSSTTKKFTNYVLAQFVQSVDDIGNMKVTGSVERLIKFPIDYCTPSNTDIYGEIAAFSWFSSTKKSYIFSIASSTGKIIYSKQLNDTSLVINFKKIKLTRGDHFKWFITEASKNKSLTDTSHFYWLTQTNANLIKDSVNILMKDFRNIDNSMKQTLLASFYNNHKLYIDMLAAYENAIKFSPNDVTFKKLYIKALDKVGLKRKAELLFKQLN